jgi:hypothetical protein
VLPRGIRTCRLLVDDHAVNAAPFQFHGQSKTRRSRADYENLLSALTSSMKHHHLFRFLLLQVTPRQYRAASRQRGMWPPQQPQACYVLTAILLNGGERVRFGKEIASVI